MSDRPPGMSITVETTIGLDPDWPPYALQTLAEDVLAVVLARMPGNPPAGRRPVRCLLDGSPHPVTSPVQDDHSPYLIHLGVRGNFPVQFAYQLAHELGHVMMETR